MPCNLGKQPVIWSEQLFCHPKCLTEIEQSALICELRWWRFLSFSYSGYFCPLPPALLRVRWTITPKSSYFAIFRLLRNSFCFQHGRSWWCLPVEGLYKFWFYIIQILIKKTVEMDQKMNICVDGCIYKRYVRSKLSTMDFWTTSA